MFEGLDSDARRLARLCWLDPSNSEHKRRYRQSEARRAGNGEVLAPVMGLAEWDAAESSAQWAAARAALAQLPEGLVLTGLETQRTARSNRRTAVYRHLATGIEFILIPGGCYQNGESGSDGAGEGGDPRAETVSLYQLWEHYQPETEGAQRQVALQPFVIARTPMLVDQGGLEQGQRPGERRPIDGVSGPRAKTLARRLGRGFRLPTEEQWEVAARAGATTRFPWGDHFDPASCWFASNSGYAPHDPAEHHGQRNGFGLIDTIGNVPEWCLTSAGLPLIRGRDGQRRRRRMIRRGGSWACSAGECRVATRNLAALRYQVRGGGIRVAAPLVPRPASSGQASSRGHAAPEPRSPAPRQGGDQEAM